MEVDENGALVELPNEDPNKVSLEDLVVDDDEVEDDNLPPASSTGLEFNPVVEEGSLEMVEEMNNAFEGDADSELESILGDMRRRKDQRLMLKTKWGTGQTTWYKMENIKIDFPVLTAKCKIHSENHKGKSSPELVWARQTVRNYDFATQRNA